MEHQLLAPHTHTSLIILSCLTLMTWGFLSSSITLYLSQFLRINLILEKLKLLPMIHSLCSSTALQVKSTRHMWLFVGYYSGNNAQGISTIICWWDENPADWTEPLNSSRTCSLTCFCSNLIIKNINTFSWAFLYPNSTMNYWRTNM